MEVTVRGDSRELRSPSLASASSPSSFRSFLRLSLFVSLPSSLRLLGLERRGNLFLPRNLQPPPPRIGASGLAVSVRCIEPVHAMHSGFLFAARRDSPRGGVHLKVTVDSARDACHSSLFRESPGARGALLPAERSSGSPVHAPTPGINTRQLVRGFLLLFPIRVYRCSFPVARHRASPRSFITVSRVIRQRRLPRDGPLASCGRAGRFVRSRIHVFRETGSSASFATRGHRRRVSATSVAGICPCGSSLSNDAGQSREQAVYTGIIFSATVSG